jgi:hypothetical protein
MNASGLTAPRLIKLASKVRTADQKRLPASSQSRSKLPILISINQEARDIIDVLIKTRHLTTSI